MCLFHRVDELRDSFDFVVESHHFSLDFDGVNYMEAGTVGREMVEKVDCGDLCVEGCRQLEFLLPYLVDNGSDEVDAGFVGSHVEGMAVEFGAVFYLFHADLGVCHVFCDGLVIETVCGGDGKHICLQVFVDYIRGDDDQYIVFVVRGIVYCLQEDRREDFTNVGNIVIGRLVTNDDERF